MDIWKIISTYMQAWTYKYLQNSVDCMEGNGGNEQEEDRI